MLNRRRRVCTRSQSSHFAEQLESRLLLNAADLDPTFGSGGYVNSQLTAPALARALASAIQSDGKLVVVGYAAGSQREMAVTRLLVGGGADSTFGVNGQVLLTPNSYATASAVAIQPNGKIVVAGSSGTGTFDTDFTVARLNTNGTLDTTFNATGIQNVITGIHAAVVNSVAIQSDGKIVLAGFDGHAFGDTHFALARLTSTGGIDTTFGTSGHVVSTITAGFNSVDTIAAVTLDSSQRIVVAGNIGTGPGSAFAVARYTSTGALDSTFGTGGIVTTQIGGTDRAAAIAVQIDGKIVIAGGADQSMAALRYTTAGALDNTFATGGKFVNTLSSSGLVPVCVTMGVLSTGAIIIGGNAYTPSFTDEPTIVRLTSTGALNPSHPLTQNGGKLNLFGGCVSSNGDVNLVGSIWNFGTSEVAETYTTDHFPADGAAGFLQQDLQWIMPAVTTAVSTLLQPDGKLLVGGQARTAINGLNSPQGFIARYNVNGTLDTSFGNGGVEPISSTRSSIANAMVLQSNGDIVYAATNIDINVTPQYVSLFRLLPTGVPDTTFAFGGPLHLSASQPSDLITGSLLQQSDGSLYLVASGQPDIIKFTAAGKPDTTYGANDHAGQGGSTGAVDSTGRVVAALYGRIIRFLPNGNYDTSFSAPVTSNVTFAAGNGGMVIQPDGKILVAGLLSNQPLIMRFNTDGSLDQSFGSQGSVVLTDRNGAFVSLSLLSNGDIIAAGQSANMFCAVFDSNGALVPSFGTAGVLTLPTTNALTTTLALRSNGKIDLVGYTYPTLTLAQLQGGIPSNTISGTGGNDTITLTRDADGTHIDWQFGAFTGQCGIADAAGLTINGKGGSDTIALVGASPLPNILHLNGTFTLNGLTGSNPLANTTLDINASTLFITYGGPSADPVSAIRGYLKNGYNAGLWNGVPSTGTGVITSQAAAGNAGHSAGVGYADSADGLVSLPANTIELKYTLYGDTGLTGAVGFTDFMRMTQHFTQATGSTWGRGDFNYDGTVDAADFALLQPNYGQTLPAAPPAMTPIILPPARTRPTTGSTLSDGMASGSNNNTQDLTVTRTAAGKKARRAAKAANAHDKKR